MEQYNCKLVQRVILEVGDKEFRLFEQNAETKSERQTLSYSILSQQP